MSTSFQQSIGNQNPTSNQHSHLSSTFPRPVSTDIHANNNQSKPLNSSILSPDASPPGTSTPIASTQSPHAFALPLKFFCDRTNLFVMILSSSLLILIPALVAALRMHLLIILFVAVVGGVWKQLTMSSLMKRTVSFATREYIEKHPDLAAQLINVERYHEKQSHKSIHTTEHRHHHHHQSHDHHHHHHQAMPYQDHNKEN